VFTVTADGFGETVASSGSSTGTGDDGLARSGWAPATAASVAAMFAISGGILMLVANRRRRWTL
jgi:signal peptidase